MAASDDAVPRPACAPAVLCQPLTSVPMPDGKLVAPWVRAFDLSVRRARHRTPIDGWESSSEMSWSHTAYKRAASCTSRAAGDGSTSIPSAR